MMRGFASRRRADEFEALVSRAADGRASAEPYADLLRVVAALRSAPEVAARPEFVADLRGRLVAEAAGVAAPARALDAATVARLTPQQRRGASERRLASVLGGFAVVAASGSMAMASQGALPGDVLYPMKRAIENAHTNLQSDDTAKADTLIQHAEQRIEEVQALSAEADADNGDAIAATLQDFTEQAGQAADLVLDDYAATGDSGSVEDLRGFTGVSMAQLTALGDAVPVEARPALITAAQTVRQADTAAFQACPTCGDAPITELPLFAGQPLDPLLTAGFRPSATGAPAEDITQILQNLDAATRVADTRAQDGEAPQGQPDPEGEPATVEEVPVTEAPEAGAHPLDGITDGVRQLLDADERTGVKSERGSRPSGAGGFEVVTDGLVDGVGGLLGGLLSE